MLKKFQSLLYFTVVSARPTTWIRLMAEMLLGFAFTQKITSFHIVNLFLAFFISGPLLWTAAYILNDLTDISLDKQHNVRKNRPIANGKLPTRAALYIILLLTSLALLIGSVFGIIFLICLLVLVLSQILYTLPSFRLKQQWPFDIILNAINGGTRFVLGFLAGGGTISSIPGFFLSFAIGLKVLLFIGHRLQNRSLEIHNNFNSTVARLSLSQVKKLLFLVFLLTGIFYIISYHLYKLGFIFLLLPPIAGLLLLPMFAQIKHGYLTNQEKAINTRVYLYLIFFIFSLFIVILKQL